MNANNRLLLCVAALAAVGLTACERPPVDSEQVGYRGTAMVQVNNPRLAPPPVVLPVAADPVPQVGPRAGEIYQNLQVLGDLPITEFNRTMVSITEWVSPEAGCNYCHIPENLASDEIYTKVVSRRMLQLTQDINKQWDDHVGETGVTCFTCHNGKPVPDWIWFTDNSEEGASNFAGNRNGQNTVVNAIGLTSMQTDPFTALLTDPTNRDIRVLTPGPFPAAEGASIQATEKTYSLMIHMSEALGVNCTYCHNSNNFGSWTGSTLARVTAWHGLNMTKTINQDYLVPLQPVYPPHRLGPSGDAPKASCATCHGGLPKPLGGAQMALEYPAFWDR
jgi:photosynthetic reaction center cytochrome c subunit